MRQLPPLKAVQAFESAARLGAFAAAAEELHLTPSAISHQIRQLEERLGVTLFHRVHRAVQLSDVGRRYAEAIGDALGRIEASTRMVERTNKSDILTVHSVPSFAAQWLMPRLSRFSSLYPDIDVRLNASVAPVDLASGEADVDIRYGHVLPASGMTIVPFPAETIVVCCAPKLLAPRRGNARRIDLAQATLIQSEVNLYGWRDWQADHPDIRLSLDRGPRFDRSFMSINWAVDGMGVALESMLLVEREVDNRKLALPLGMKGSQRVCHSLTYLKSKSHLQKMQVFQTWLFEELSRSMAAVEAQRTAV